MTIEFTNFSGSKELSEKIKKELSTLTIHWYNGKTENVPVKWAKIDRPYITKESQGYNCNVRLELDGVIIDLDIWAEEAPESNEDEKTIFTAIDKNADYIASELYYKYQGMEIATKMEGHDYDITITLGEKTVSEWFTVFNEVEDYTDYDQDYVETCKGVDQEITEWVKTISIKHGIIVNDERMAEILEGYKSHLSLHLNDAIVNRR